VSKPGGPARGGMVRDGDGRAAMTG